MSPDRAALELPGIVFPVASHPLAEKSHFTHRPGNHGARVGRKNGGNGVFQCGGERADEGCIVVASHRTPREFCQVHSPVINIWTSDSGCVICPLRHS